MGWVATAYTAAPVLGVPIAAFVAESIGWRANYMAFAAAGLFLALAVEASLREAHTRVPRAVSELPLVFLLTRHGARRSLGVFHHRGRDGFSSLSRSVSAKGAWSHAGTGGNGVPLERSRESRRRVRSRIPLRSSRKEEGRSRGMPRSFCVRPRRPQSGRARTLRGPGSWSESRWRPGSPPCSRS